MTERTRTLAHDALGGVALVGLWLAVYWLAWWSLSLAEVLL